MTTLIKDPSPGGPTTDGSTIYTDQHNALVDRLGGETALTANRALNTNGSGNIEVSAVTETELDFLSGVTSAIQTQLDSKISDITGESLSDLSDVTITSIASDEIIKWNGSAWINNTLAEAGIAASSHTHVEADITDLGSYITASSTDTLTNKTIDADGTGNVITNIGSSEIKAEIVTGLTEEETPATGDFLLGVESGGALRKFDVGDLPSGGGGDMVLADTQTVTGAKTFADDAFLIQNPATTFEYLFQGGAILADRTITLPVLTGNDTLVFEAHAQTLTNKTIDANNNTISNIALGAEATGALDDLSDVDTTGIATGAMLYKSAGDWIDLAIGSNGEVLKVSSGIPSWETEGGGTSHALLSATHTDATTDTVARGDIIVGDSTPEWSALTIGSANTVLKSDGTDATWGALAKADLPATVVYTDQANTFGDFDQTFKDDRLKIENPAGTFTYTIEGQAIGGNRVLSLPQITADDFLVAGNHTQTLTNKTLTTPTIGDFTNATHNHQNNAGGGTLVATSALTATGTKDSTTFLRGDDTWAVPSGGSSLPVADTTSIVEGSADNTKELRFEVDGNSTGVVGVIETTFTTAKTITIPDATDTLVGKATSDTLTNKTFDANGTGNSITNIENADIASGAAIAISKLASLTADVLIGRGNTGGTPIEIDASANGVAINGSNQLVRAALTGDVTASEGSNTTAIAAGAIVNADVNASAAIAITKLDSNVANATGDTFTGVHDFGGATSLEIPNGAAPTVDAAGEIAIDTTITDFTGLIKYHDGTEELAVVAMPVAQLTSPTDEYAVVYDAAADEFQLKAQSGSGGGGSWDLLGHTELGSDGDVIAVTWAGEEREILKVHVELITDSGQILPELELGDGSIDTGTNYEWSYLENGTNGENNADNSIRLASLKTGYTYMWFDITIYNSTDGRKVVTWNGGAADETTDIININGSGIYKSTTANIDRLEIQNVGTGDFVTASKVEVIGRNFNQSGSSVSPIGLHDIHIPAASMWPTATAGCAELARTELATNDINIQTLDFDTSTEENAQFRVTLPRNYNNGTITFVVHWTAASGSGGVTWELKGVATGNDDAMDAAFGTPIDVDDTLITANDEHLSPESTALTIAGTPADSDGLHFNIARKTGDANDTLGVDAKLLGVDVYFTTDAAVTA